MKTRYLILLLIVGLIIFIAGCNAREPLLEKALIPVDLAPSISSMSPEESFKSVPINAKIYIEFQTPMDTKSVENNTYLKYGNTVLDKSDLSFTWDSTNTLLIIDPIIDLPPDTEITVVIETEAKNEMGIHFIKPFTCTFVTYPSAEPDTTPPSIVSFNPSLYEVTTAGTQVQITFSEEMSHISVEKSFIIESADNQEIYTHTSGSFSWNGSTMIFTPDNQLSLDKEYIIGFSSTDFAPQDLAGNLLTGNQTSRFFTLNNVIYVSSSSGDDNNPGYHRTIPVKTINTGLQRAVEYGYNLINVEEGTYLETIDLDSQQSGITIKGSYIAGNSFNNRDINNNPTIVQATGSNYTVTISGGSNIKFDGVFIKGGTYSSSENGGINIINSSGITLQNCTIFGTETSITDGIALNCKDSSSLRILDSKIYGASGTSANLSGNSYGIKASSSSLLVLNGNISALEGGASASGTSYGLYIDNISSTTSSLTIQNSTINQAGIGGNTGAYGLYLTDNSSSPSSDLSISISSIYGGNSSGNIYGVYADGFSLNITSSDIYGGDSSSGTTYGIYAKNSQGIDITSNSSIRSGDSSGASSTGICIETSSNITISGNSQIEGNQSGTPVNSYGIYINNSNTCTISNNSITGGLSQISYGIKIVESDVTIDGNSNITGSSGSDENFGIYLDGNNNQVTISNNSTIYGGDVGINTNCGIYLKDNNISDNTGNTVTIENNQNISGGLTGEIYGIHAINTNITIKNNSIITAGDSSGDSSSNPSYGIKILESGIPITAKIKDNTYIDGGDANSANTYGIHASGSNLTLRVYRNTIIGGNETSVNSNTCRNHAVYIDNINLADIFNNFIIGSGTINNKESTDSNNNCYGIYAINTQINIINNTIDGGLNTSGNGNSYAIFLTEILPEGSSISNQWLILPVIINNIIAGGQNNLNVGIYVDKNIDEVPCTIYNNSFISSTIDRFIDEPGGRDIKNIADLNSTKGGNYFEPDPTGNIDNADDPDSEIFSNRLNFDYHINYTDPNMYVRNAGYNNNYNNLFDKEGFKEDIDNDIRPIPPNYLNYSYIDLGADEFFTP